MSLESANRSVRAHQARSTSASMSATVISRGDLLTGDQRGPIRAATSIRVSVARTALGQISRRA